jgi:hypothetical protein
VFGSALSETSTPQRKLLLTCRDRFAKKRGPAKNAESWVPVLRKSKSTQLTPASGTGYVRPPSYRTPPSAALMILLVASSSTSSFPCRFRARRPSSVSRNIGSSDARAAVSRVEKSSAFTR